MNVNFYIICVARILFSTKLIKNKLNEWEGNSIRTYFFSLDRIKLYKLHGKGSTIGSNPPSLFLFRPFFAVLPDVSQTFRAEDDTRRRVSETRLRERSEEKERNWIAVLIGSLLML